VSSGVFINVVETDNYFINSEGTEIATTDFMVGFSANAQVKTEEGEFIFDHISHRVLSLDKLPDVETLRKEVKQMADRLTTLKKTEVFKDSYTGPVLFVGTAAADVFSSSLFSFGESFSASKNITNGYSSTDSKLGKKVVDDRFTIKSIPKMKSFNDIELLGSYEVDAEGVIPPDELVLVEGGVLKNLFSDRTVTKEGQTSNGHGSGPGVITVSANSGVSLDKLKEQLIETAKEEGLEYALIVKHFSAGGVRSINTYKVSLKDGKEELVRSANVRSMNLKSLKKVLGVSNEQIARNTEVGRFGTSLSLIAPNAILLEEVEVEGVRSNPFLDKEVYVENPVKGSN
jgi:predicted Zn-dependent protease